MTESFASDSGAKPKMTYQATGATMSDSGLTPAQRIEALRARRADAGASAAGLDPDDGGEPSTPISLGAAVSPKGAAIPPVASIPPVAPIPPTLPASLGGAPTMPPRQPLSQAGTSASRPPRVSRAKRGQGSTRGANQAKSAGIQVTLPSPARMAAAGASVVSFAAMVVAMGPLTAQADGAGDAGEDEVDELAFAADSSSTTLVAPVPNVVVEVIPNYVEVPADQLLDGEAPVGTEVEGLVAEGTEPELVVPSSPQSVSPKSAAPSASTPPATSAPTAAPTPAAPTPAAPAAPTPAAPATTVAPAPTAAPTTAAPAPTAPPTTAAPAPAPTNPPPPPKSDKSG